MRKLGCRAHGEPSGARPLALLNDDTQELPFPLAYEGLNRSQDSCGDIFGKEQFMAIRERACCPTSRELGVARGHRGHRDELEKAAGLLKMFVLGWGDIGQ